MEPFPLVIPIQVRVQGLDEPRKGELVMRTCIPAAGEGPGVPCLHPDQRTDLLFAFGFTLTAWRAEGTWRNPFGMPLASF